MGKTIYLTVDTECHDINKVNQYIYGDDHGEQYGVKKILELAKEENIPVNFFLDVVENREYGEKYIMDIINMIKSYNQPIFLHVHPEFVTKDSRSFIWEYSNEEQRNILEKGIDDYEKFVGKSDTIVFRAGRYGVNMETYDILSQMNKKIIDLSYCYDAHKMCHVSEKDIHTKNKAVKYKNLILQPNTKFIGFDYLGKKKSFHVDAADATFDEFKTFITKTKLDNVIWTMHSWNFIKRWFFKKDNIHGDKAMVKKFHKSVAIARQQGFTFGNLNDYQYDDYSDELLNLCKGFKGKIKGIINNFFRFQKIARINKKYFIIYASFYIMLICLVVLLAIFIL